MNSDFQSRPKILIHCQYVYGIGHLVRAAELARGLSERFQVFMLIGGEMVPNYALSELVKFIELPAIYKEENSEYLTPVDPAISLKKCFLMRRGIINQAIDEIKPDIFITEHFPFGLLFEEEVRYAITEVRNVKPEAKIVSSVRDLIESNKGGKFDSYTCNLINTLYDVVLVHGDGNFAPLSKSFPKFSMINVPIYQTGYIVRTIPMVGNTDDLPVILTSVGGGRLGNELLDALIDSHLRLKSVKKHRMILFSGAFQKDFKKQVEKVASLDSNDITICMFDSQKYLKYLSFASLVISLGGYNSIIESVTANRTILVYQREFAGGNQEQSLRIKLFEKIGQVEVITSKDLKVEILLNIILRKLHQPKVAKSELDIRGAQNSCDILSNLLNLPAVS